jgi:phage shock protein A
MAEEPKTVSLEEAIEGKKSKLIEAEKQITIAEQTFAQPETAAEIESLYSRFRTGKYENLERNRVRWIPPGPRCTKPT